VEEDPALAEVQRREGVGALLEDAEAAGQGGVYAGVLPPLVGKGLTQFLPMLMAM
jgi:hypothetical protein